MSAARRPTSSWLRRSRRSPALRAAAFLALLLQLMFPAGFMAAAPGQAHGLPIVICSAQGPAVVDWDAVVPGPHKPSPAKQSMAHCAFAGHAATSDPPVPAALPAPVVFAIADAPARRFPVIPGRGLAAPPPPAIGPPPLI